MKKNFEMAIFRGWRYTAFIGGFIGLLGLTLYPIAISPMIDVSEYSKIINYWYYDFFIFHYFVSYLGCSI